jgi:hypothetical protein
LFIKMHDDEKYLGLALVYFGRLDSFRPIFHTLYASRKVMKSRFPTALGSVFVRTKSGDF